MFKLLFFVTVLEYKVSMDKHKWLYNDKNDMLWLGGGKQLFVVHLFIMFINAHA